MVQVLPTAKTPEEAAKEQRDEDHKTTEQRWTIGIGVATAAILLLQLFVFGRQATRLKQTIEKMDAIAKDQATDMAAYIEQTTRFANGVDGIVSSMAANLVLLQDTLKISREISDTNTRIADTSTASMHATQRAKLNVVHVQFDKFGPGHFPEVLVQVLNAGLSPATITATFDFVLTEMPLEQQRPTEVFLQRSGVVAPGRTVTVTSRLADTPPLTDDDWDRIQAGTFTLALYGAIQYDAGFDIAGEVGYGFNFDVRLTRLPIHQRLGATPIPGYNYST